MSTQSGGYKMNKIKRMLTCELIKYYTRLKRLKKLESNLHLDHVSDRMADCVEELVNRACRNDEEAFQFVDYSFDIG